MLPGSHNSASISPGPEVFSPEAGFAIHALDQIEFPGGLTSPAGSSPTAASAHALAEAFSTFVSTSTRLENAYRELQVEVSGLRAELGQRNAALNASLAENQRVRKALQQIVDSMPCGVIVATREGRLTTVNPEAQKMLAHTGAAALPETLAQAEAGLGTEGLLTNLSTRGEYAEQVFCRESPAGDRWIHVLARQITSSAFSTVTGPNLFILRDITAQKREESHRESARNAAVLAEITTMLAHEIRNPLASLELFTDLVEKDDAGREEWVANLRAGIRTLSGTVNNVLSFHEDAGRLQLAPLSLTELVGSTVRFAKPMVDQAGSSLQWMEGTPPLRVLGSYSALQQVLLNLIRNAVRHAGENATITISLEEPADKVLLHCTDTGPGVPEDQLARIFEPGFSGSGDSPGLGLAVCRRIMKQHNGTISASNLPGAGARFTLTLSIAAEEPHRS